jgi:aspartyl-tRNA(Asn)/glutamyl-tRNA(Gln) amidotransferase subunit C
MSQLTREQILKLAKLSRLSLTEDEINKYQKELGDILDYVKRLESVDVSGLTPTYQVTGLSNVTREDTVVETQADPKQLLNNSPKSQDGYIKVGRMI